MHEFVLADRLLQSALDYMNDHELSSIHYIDVELGELLGLENESLQMAFHLLSKGSRVETSRLKIKRVKGKAKCNKCGYVGGLDRVSTKHMIDPAFGCPKCGVPVKIIKGKELKITSIS